MKCPHLSKQINMIFYYLWLRIMTMPSCPESYPLPAAPLLAWVVTVPFLPQRLFLAAPPPPPAAYKSPVVSPNSRVIPVSPFGPAHFICPQPPLYEPSSADVPFAPLVPPLPPSGP